MSLVVLIALGGLNIVFSDAQTIVETAKIAVMRLKAEFTHLVPTDILAAQEETAPSLSPGADPGPELASSRPGQLATVEPPVPAQGGTCIEGSLIDHYHQVVGAGWKVTAVRTEDNKTHTTYANGQGHFAFSGLGAGEWTITIEVPEGWQDITPRSFKVTLSGNGTACAKVRYKGLRPACLNVVKLDAYGKLGLPDKVGIPGWEITVSNGTLTRQCVTDGLGRCHFTNLPPDIWTVHEEHKIGWTPSLGYSSKRTITLESPRAPGICEDVTFVNEQVHDGCIDVCKADANGQPLSGWQIRVIRNDGTQPSEAQTTGTSGCVRFMDLTLGEWTVQEHVEDWWRPIGDASQTLTLTEPGMCKHVDFTNEPLGCIDGYKINHLDQGLSGWVIKATSVETGEEFTTVTDQDGYFKFKGLPLGRWIISEETQVGWEAVTPGEFEVPLTEPFTCVHVRFKNRTQFACIDVFKKDAWDGSGLPGWEIVLKPAYGSTKDVVVKTTDGTGYVRFNGLTPGVYDISERLQPGWVALTPLTQRLTLQATGSCMVVTFKNRQENTPTCDTETQAPSTLPCTGDTSSSALTPTPTSVPHNPCQVIHVVQRGNTLYSIAKQYGSTVAEIQQSNNIVSNAISVGQRLCIP
jgi:LysM repeat protein